MTRLDALFVPNNILDCHIPDKTTYPTAIFRMVLHPKLVASECLVYVCPRTETTPTDPDEL